MKQTLEKVLNSVKEIWKNAKEHWKETLTAIALPFIFGYKINAATFEAHNYSSDNPAISSYMRFKTAEGYQEWHGPEDILFLEHMAPRLEIFSDPNGIKYHTDGRPPQTPGVDMHLNVKGTIDGPLNNSLWIKVTDASGLEHRKAIVYDISNPETVYDVNTTPEVWTTIVLPEIVNKQDEVYATWHIATPALVPGDIASAGAQSVGALDGKVDIYDLEVIADSWLYETFEGENYSWGDLNYDGINNFRDFGIMANSWLREE